MNSDFEKTAVCGLLCDVCSLYIGSHFDRARNERLSEKFGIAPQDMECDGCRSEVNASFCKSCDFKLCVAQKGIDFCFECGDYPCEKLKEFQASKPHRIELWDYNNKIKESGFEKFREDTLPDYQCQNCGAINSTYDLKCYKCGNDPGSNYANRHREEILKHLENFK